MLDFTSCNYLGFRHDSESLRPWCDLTFGAPAALREIPGAVQTGNRTAALAGCERGCLLPSTLHAFMDVFRIWPLGTSICFDRGAYAIARWAIERARCQGYRTIEFRPHDAGALERIIAENALHRPVVVCDGYCPEQGRFAPLPRYVAAVRRAGGSLVIDDTQAIGLYGRRDQGHAPYGWGGGGSVAWFGLEGPGIVVIGSLAKAFGVPVALLASDRRSVRRFQDKSECRVHCSPVSAAHVAAAEHALECNAIEGEARRIRLARWVKRFRSGLSAAGIRCAGGSFPIQRLLLPEGADADGVLRRIERSGVKPVLLRGADGSQARITFVINAAHSAADIDAALDAILRATGR